MSYVSACVGVRVCVCVLRVRVRRTCVVVYVCVYVCKYIGRYGMVCDGTVWEGV